MRRVALSGPMPAAVAVGGVAVHTDRLAATLAATGREMIVLDDSNVYAGMPAPGVGVPAVVGVRGASLAEVWPLAWRHGAVMRAARRRAITSRDRCALHVPLATAVVRSFLVGTALRAFDAEVLHLQQADFRPLFADWAGVHIPRVITVHGLGGLETGEYPALRRVVPANLGRADAIATPSRALADEVAALGVPLERVRVVPNGVDHDVFFPRERSACRTALGLDADTPLAVYVGRVTAHKGAGDLLDAWRLVREELPDASLVLVGPATGEVAAERPGVRATAAVDQPTAALWIGAADVVAVPSRYEGFGLAALEAMASGRAVVATRVGGLPELVSERVGCLVPPRDPDALAGALVRLLTDPLAASAAGDAGARVASAYTWESAAEAYGSLYDAL